MVVNCTGSSGATSHAANGIIMTGYTWAKIYIDILDDPKMGALPSDLWRRVIELILLAKQANRGGFLPGVFSMAWTLRCSQEALEADLQKLSQPINGLAPIVEIKSGEWFLTKFEARQSFESGQRRTAQYRKRLVTQSSDDSVTTCHTEEEEDTDTDIPTEAKARTLKGETKEKHKAAEPTPEAVKAYRSVARTFPDKATWGSIADTVGNDAARLKFWREVVSAYIALGWNKRNVVGMLDWFSRKELPHLQRSGNGKGKVTARHATPADVEADFERLNHRKAAVA